MFVIFSSRIRFSLSISVYRSINVLTVVVVTFKHLSSFWFRYQMAVVAWLFNYLSRLHVIETSLVNFMLNLIPFFV